MDSWNYRAACCLVMCLFILVCIITNLVGMMEGLGMGVDEKTSVMDSNVKKERCVGY